MKYHRKYLLLMLLFLAGLSAGAQEQLYKGQLHIVVHEPAQKGDSLYIGMKVDISGVEIGTYRSLDLIPVIKAEGQEIALPFIRICGHSRYKSYQRIMALSGKYGLTESSPLLVVCNRQPALVNYSYTLPFEEWMETARLDLKEDLCGCGGATRQIRTQQIADHISLEKATLAKVYEEPPVPPPPITQRVSTGEAQINFPVGKSNILPAYGNNSEELKKLQELAGSVNNGKGVAILGFTITGYASPEGASALNRKLSQTRAVALKEYLTKLYNFPDSLYKVDFKGEDEEGLIKEVKKSDMKYRQEVLDILRNVPLTNSSKAKLRDLKGGEPYHYMLKKIYPSLRRATVVIKLEEKNEKQADGKQ